VCMWALARQVWALRSAKRPNSWAKVPMGLVRMVSEMLVDAPREDELEPEGHF
jgi:hypothetical protein